MDALTSVFNPVSGERSSTRGLAIRLTIALALGHALIVPVWAQPTETDRRALEKKRERQKERREAPEAPTTPGSGNPEVPRQNPSTSPESEAGVLPRSARDAWTIALAVFRGEGHAAEAQDMLAKVRTRGLITNARAERRGPATLICVGSFSGPDEARAREELKRVQSLEVDGDRAYLTAYLAPPAHGQLEGQTPQFSLVRAKQTLGSDALYTLQVGVYGRRDLPRPSENDLRDLRRAAEEAASRLRQEGEQAFYHHGPRMSMVTIGLFNQDDFDPQTPSFKSSRLLAAQKRFPYNLYNGKGVQEKLGGQAERLQPSNLVAIPDAR